MIYELTTSAPSQAPKVCGYCGKKFVASSKARWCSARCKQAAYRQRRDRKTAKRVTP